MKALFSRCCALALALSGAGPVAAGIPTGAFPADQLGAARVEAEKAGRPLALLLSDSDNEKEQFLEQEKNALRSLKRYAVIVYVESNKGGMEHLPPPAFTALSDLRIGGFIPRFVLATPDLSDSWGGVSATMLSGEQARTYLKRSEDETEAKMAAWKPGAPPAKDPAEQQFKWGMKGNKMAKGKFVELLDDKLRIDGPNGEKYQVPRADLTDASLAFAKALAGAASAQRFEIETWTSSDGRPLQAKFVSLEGDKVTLETAAGKRYTLPLSRLDVASVDRAKELAEAPAE